MEGPDSQIDEIRAELCKLAKLPNVTANPMKLQSICVESCLAILLVKHGKRPENDILMALGAFLSKVQDVMIGQNNNSVKILLEFLAFGQQ